MKALQRPTQFITDLGNRFAPRNDQTRHTQEVTAVIIAIAAAVLLGYYLLA